MMQRVLRGDIMIHNRRRFRAVSAILVIVLLFAVFLVLPRDSLLDAESASGCSPPGTESSSAFVSSTYTDESLSELFTSAENFAGEDRYGRHASSVLTEESSSETTGSGNEQSARCAEHLWQEQNRREPTRVLDGKVDYVCSRCKATMSRSFSHLRDIADTDMCGESLIEKPLLHTKNYDLMKQVFDVYHAHYPVVMPGGENSIVIPREYTKNPQDILAEYPYFRTAYSVYTVAWDSNCPSELIVFYDEKRAEKAAMCYNRANEILAQLGIDNHTTQKDAIVRINNYLCDFKHYDYDALNDIRHADSGMYHSLFDSLGICHNYAVAFQVLCLSAGIECHYFFSSSMNHAWNVIYFSDGSQLHVDCCWNDSRVRIDGVSYEVDCNNVSPELRETMRTGFLLLTPDEMRKSHSF